MLIRQISCIKYTKMVTNWFSMEYSVGWYSCVCVQIWDLSVWGRGITWLESLTSRFVEDLICWEIDLIESWTWLELWDLYLNLRAWILICFDFSPVDLAWTCWNLKKTLILEFPGFGLKRFSCLLPDFGFSHAFPSSRLVIFLCTCDFSWTLVLSIEKFITTHYLSILNLI